MRWESGWMPLRLLAWQRPRTLQGGRAGLPPRGERSRDLSCKAAGALPGAAPTPFTSYQALGRYKPQHDLEGSDLGLTERKEIVHQRSCEK